MKLTWMTLLLLALLKYVSVLFIVFLLNVYIKDYIKHHHARKLNEFVIHLLHEGSEPQHFWDLLVSPSSQQSTSSIDVMRNPRRDKLEEDHEEIDSLISDINSMVVNLSTSSVPNLTELATENTKTLSLHHDRFRLMKDSPLSHSCQADLQFVGMNKSNAKQEDNAKMDEKETQPTRQRWSLKVDPTTYQWLTLPAGTYGPLYYAPPIDCVFVIIFAKNVHNSHI